MVGLIFRVGLCCRYPPHGRRVISIEHGVPWERLRAPPIDASPHDLHISDRLNELHPGDHIEIQWRRNKEFPYGMFHVLFSSASCLSFQPVNVNQFKQLKLFVFKDFLSSFLLGFFLRMWIGFRMVENKGTVAKKLCRKKTSSTRKQQMASS